MEQRYSAMNSHDQNITQQEMQKRMAYESLKGTALGTASSIQQAPTANNSILLSGLEELNRLLLLAMDRQASQLDRLSGPRPETSNDSRGLGGPPTIILMLENALNRANQLAEMQARAADLV